MATPTFSEADRYADVFHPPTHDQFPDPVQISYGDLFDLQMGHRHTGYIKQRHSIDHEEDVLRQQAERMAQLQAELEAEWKKFFDYGMCFEHLSSRDDDESHIIVVYPVRVRRTCGLFMHLHLCTHDVYFNVYVIVLY